jgi:hypothetical protein
MTSSREPPQAEPEPQEPEAPHEAEDEPADPPSERPQRPQRQRRQREQNAALDPRLVQLERRSHGPSRVGDVSLIVIGVAAFVFGVFMHYYVATSILNDDGEAESAGTTIAATATPAGTAGGATVTPSVQPQATATPLPDRTSCDEIRGTQYRSVSEREFFLANCTG